jgi:tetratricopeptide (TPR) repeat protein
MADLFISYSSDDRSYVKDIVREFESQGWTVWWDRHIEAGSSFDKKIEEALDDSRCVVVVWSRSSINSDWVRAEAAEGLERNTLVPILLDDVKPPLLFRQKQAISLIDWKQNSSSPSLPLKNLIPSIQSILDSYRESNIPVSTQRSWALARISNHADNEMLGEALYQAVRLGLSFFENAFLYTADFQGIRSDDLSAEQLNDLVDEEGLDGSIHGEIEKTGQQYRFSITVRSKDGETATCSRATDDPALLTSLAGEMLVEKAMLLQGSMPAGHEEMVRYLGDLKIESLYAFSQSFISAYKNDYESARRLSKEAIQLNEDFLPAYRGWAIACLYLGQQDEAKKVIARATQSMGNDSPRNKLFARGMYYAVYSEDHEKAAKEFEALVQLSPVDESAINNLAVCRFYQLDFRSASELSARDLQLYPDKILGKQNAAFYALFAGDFDEATKLAIEVVDQDPAYVNAVLIQALVSEAKGEFSSARALYNSVLADPARNQSIVLQGLADLALAEGRWDEAEQYLDRGIEVDSAAQNHEYQARKLLMKAECLLSAESRYDRAVQLMDEALTLSTSTPTLMTAVILCILFDLQKTAPLLKNLRQKVNAQGRAYARMTAGVEDYLSGNLGQASNEITLSLDIADLWLIRFSLALVYLDAGLSMEATDELEICASRKGEALSAALDEQPTYRYLARVLRQL